MNGEWERDQTKFLLSIIREGTQIQTEQIRDRFCNLVRLKGAVTFPIPYVEQPCISEKENQRFYDECLPKWSISSSSIKESRYIWMKENKIKKKDYLKPLKK